MERKIVRDTFFLSQKSIPADENDLNIAEDLRDTLTANRERCVGLAANMIGFSKNIIAFFDGEKALIMLNPVILKQSEPYETQEGCLSLDGVRRTTRYRKIKVQWQTEAFKPMIKTFTGFSAQIIQHEIDHLFGKII